MIDYFFKFANEAAAIADTSGTQFYKAATADSPASWNLDRVVPGVQVWRASQDVTGSTVINGVTVPTVTHTYLPGWFAIVSLPDIRPALINHANLQLAIDRELANSGQTAILKSNVAGAILQDIRFSPTFAGSNFPFGALK